MFPITIQAIPGPYVGRVPTTFQELVNAVASNTTYQWNDGGNVTFFTGTTFPTSAFHGTGVWFRDDTNGNPIGIYTYFNGNWVPIPQGGNASGALKYFTGYWPTYFDGSGLGLRNHAWAGYALCNGNNGTPNLANKFLIPGRYYTTTGWETMVESFGIFKPFGGTSTTTLTASNLPALTWQILLEQQFTGLKTSGGSYVISTDTGPSNGQDVELSSPLVMWDPKSVGGQQPIYTLPPFMVLGVAMWMGYN